MKWNWQKSAWPRFSWDASRLARLEAQFLQEAGVFVGAHQHLETDVQEELIVELLSAEALTTSEIEGEILDRASVQSSLRKQLGLASDRRRAKPAERGIAELMIDLYRGFPQPLSHQVLFRWHQMLMRGHSHLVAGHYRTGNEPMQVISGAIHQPKVHFEAPPSAAVPAEMDRFVAWFHQTASGPLPALTRAGLAHLYFVSVHPFEDGNGRIARALSEKALAQGLDQPVLVALGPTILHRRKSYYAALEAANKGLEVTAWLIWFAETALEAHRKTITRVEFLIAQTRLLDRLRHQLNPRQHKALLRLFREGPAGFEGGLSASNYMTITGASPATATRDLADLVTNQALVRAGDGRYARYHLFSQAPHG